jgi:hypothetical protein
LPQTPEKVLLTSQTLSEPPAARLRTDKSNEKRDCFIPGAPSGLILSGREGFHWEQVNGRAKS